MYVSELGVTSVIRTRNRADAAAIAPSFHTAVAPATPLTDTVSVPEVVQITAKSKLSPTAVANEFPVIPAAISGPVGMVHVFVPDVVETTIPERTSLTASEYEPDADTVVCRGCTLNTCPGAGMRMSVTFAGLKGVDEANEKRPVAAFMVKNETVGVENALTCSLGCRRDTHRVNANTSW